ISITDNLFVLKALLNVLSDASCKWF
ncbi:MAG: hypothetical protein EZS28_049477, partial [Streblomastix strix]